MKMHLARCIRAPHPPTAHPRCISTRKRKCARIGILGRFRPKCVFAENGNALFAPNAFRSEMKMQLARYTWTFSRQMHFRAEMKMRLARCLFGHFRPKCIFIPKWKCAWAVYLSVFAPNAFSCRNGNARRRYIPHLRAKTKMRIDRYTWPFSRQVHVRGK